MERSFYYRVTAYSFITLLSVMILLPSVADWTHTAHRLPEWYTKMFSRKIALGLDLQGGLHLVYEVQVDKAVSDKADRLAAQIEEKLAKDRKVKGAHVSREGDGAESRLRVTFQNKADARKLDRAFEREFAKYLTRESDNGQTGETVFKMDASRLPGYAGVDLPGAGYALYKLVGVNAGDALDDARKQALLRQLNTLEAQEEVQSYLAALRSRYKVEINKAVLESKEK